MGLLKGHKILLCSLFFFLCSGAALAAPMGYSDYDAFMADLPGPATTLDFDSLADGTIIADGDTVDGITFDYPVLAGYGVSMMITCTGNTQPELSTRVQRDSIIESLKAGADLAAHREQLGCAGREQHVAGREGLDR